jgi:hypothetical protein
MKRQAHGAIPLDGGQAVPHDQVPKNVSTIVARVLIGLVRRSTDSILSEPNWVPTLGNGHFDLAKLFQLAGV